MVTAAGELTIILPFLTSTSMCSRPGPRGPVGMVGWFLFTAPVSSLFAPGTQHGSFPRWFHSTTGRVAHEGKNE